MTYISTETCRAPARRTSWGKKFISFRNLARSRRALRKLNAQHLADIGFSKAQADAEARKPLWDVPDHWQE